MNESIQEFAAKVDRSQSAKPAEPAVKNDAGKLRWDLLPTRSLEDIAGVFTMGAKKYADNNWRLGMSWGRVFGAMMRHLWAFWRGEDIDPESGMPHLAHAGFGILVLLEFRRTKPGFDDRGDTKEFNVEVKK